MRRIRLPPVGIIGGPFGDGTEVDECPDIGKRDRGFPYLQVVAGH